MAAARPTREKRAVNDDHQQPLPGITVRTGRRAVRVSSERPLTALSSAVVGGGYGSTREILNVHVDDRYDGGRPDEDLAGAAAELGVTEPFVGLMTAASTEFARCAVEALGALTVAAVVRGQRPSSCAVRQSTHASV